ncbi:nucleotide exchange factor GrpE [Rhodococcus ruber]|uniref:Nucleotide exchange factor GrpE n=1 Tax=Rhodococcus ruber TaxID=1830 RepID=A0ABT4MJM7_9NOCA|nr:nucleotide exchange factor GrpE [Rhodococcus ruber]MCZ4521190.1 nucleotide exchange factor GrpE [Rhodococcus ruber]
MSTPVVLVLIAAALTVGGLGGWIAHASSRPHDNPPTPGHVVPLTNGPDRRLIDAMIGVHDLGDGVSATDRITEELSQVGIVRLDAAPGSTFDSSRHKAVHSVAAALPEQIGTVAGEVRPGWAGPDGIIRYTEVSVFARPAAGR